MPTTLLHYDSARRRLWILGQRCHHGATGALLAAAGASATVRLGTPAFTALVAAGGAMMAHDWSDRSIWFERGWQNQP
ncbi:MAG: hypothetical protein QOF76_2695 [Solirubrobacteraceae bacterium]|jgi:hypothetical protein|nr:hypothetical protein [Solirubrobacteraceae bacterium]